MRRITRLLLLASVMLLGFGCASSQRSAQQRRGNRDEAAVLSLDLAETRPAGQGTAFRPPAVNDRRVALGIPVGRLRCRGSRAASYGAHIELFAANRGLLVPAGIGIGLGGRCVYPLRTATPTGVIEIDRSRAFSPPTLGELFALWGQPLSARRLASFAGSVSAFVDGRRWRGDPRAVPLAPHAQVVLELGPFVEPHASYLFPPGL